jgi:hypothetical protein
MPEPRLFSLEEANALIPQLNGIVRLQMERQNEIDRRFRRLVDRLGEVPERLDVVAKDSADVRALKRDLEQHVRAYQKGWADVTALGAVVKDERAGLVDFYGRLDGRLVFLCWRFGEEKIEFFHELYAGFSSRKPLEEGQLHKLYN